MIRRTSVGLSVAGVALVVGILLFVVRPGRPASAGHSVGGSVKTLSGRPLAGAVVELFAVDASQSFESLGRAETDRDGGYSLAFAVRGGPERLLVLRASADGCATEGRALELGTNEQHFRLSEETSSVRVRVVDSLGRAAAGAKVLLTFEPVAAAKDALYTFEGATERTGAFLVRGLPVLAGSLHVLAEHGRARSFREYRKRGGSGVTEVTIELEVGRALRGRLVPSEPGDLTAAEVVLREAEGPWRSVVRPSGEGRFNVDAAPVGSLLVAEVSGEWVLARDVLEHPFRVAKGEGPFQLELAVVPGGVLEGFVVDSGGRRVPGATITVTPDQDFAGGARRLVTDGAGQFAVGGLSRAVTWTVEARHSDRAPARRSGLPARSRGIELQLGEGGALVGRVVDRAGRGVPEVEVYAHAMERTGPVASALPEHMAVRTDAAGRYRLGRMNPGTYRFEVRPLARMQWSSVASVVREIEVHEGDNVLADVVVARGASLLGRVDSPVESMLELALLPSGRDGNPHRVTVQPTRGGTFEVRDLEEGDYRIAARSADRGWSEPANASLGEGRRSEVSLRFAGAARLEGKVALASGVAARNARVDVFRGSGAERAPHDWTGNWSVVDETGRFTVPGLVPGAWTVRITSENAAPLVEAIEVKGGTASASFTLEEGATLVVDLVAAPRADAGSKVVIVESSQPRGVRTQGVADGRGHLRFDHLPAGRYDVRVVSEGMPQAVVDLPAKGEGRVEIRLD